MGLKVRKVLMVDDDIEDRDLLMDTFAELGHPDCIHYENDGEQALAYLRHCATTGQVPCVIILDLNMPRFNGRQVLQQLKSDPVLREITTIIYSTSFNPIEQKECMLLGAHSYVIKPVTYAESIEVANGFIELCDM